MREERIKMKAKIREFKKKRSNQQILISKKKTRWGESTNIKKKM